MIQDTDIDKSGADRFGALGESLGHLVLSATQTGPACGWGPTSRATRRPTTPTTGPARERRVRSRATPTGWSPTGADTSSPTPPPTTCSWSTPPARSTCSPSSRPRPRRTSPGRGRRPVGPDVGRRRPRRGALRRRADRRPVQGRRRPGLAGRPGPSADGLRGGLHEHLGDRLRRDRPPPRARDRPARPDRPGRVRRADRGRAPAEPRTVLRSGLVSPTGLAVGPDGSIYISNYGSSPSTGAAPTARSSASRLAEGIAVGPGRRVAAGLRPQASKVTAIVVGYGPVLTSFPASPAPARGSDA